MTAVPPSLTPVDETRIPTVAVIVCTHNPTPAYWKRVMDALQQQTLPRQDWELLIIDNDSIPSVASHTDPSWHPAGRICTEPQLGVTHARLRGIRESRAPLLVFVDDDNVVARDYLEQAITIAREHPYLGAWCGNVVPEFEVEPAAWTRPYLPLLALRSFERPIWANFTTMNDTVPCGAGMCFRRLVADEWVRRSSTDPRRLQLGRAGQSLASGEDADLAYTACDLGYGTGGFPQLQLTHLIPARRLTLPYLERLAEEMYASDVLLRSLRHEVTEPPRHSLARRWFDAYVRIRLSPEARRMQDACERGQRRGYDTVLRLRGESRSQRIFREGEKS